MPFPCLSCGSPHAGQAPIALACAYSDATRMTGHGIDMPVQRFAALNAILWARLLAGVLEEGDVVRLLLVEADGAGLALLREAE